MQTHSGFDPPAAETKSHCSAHHGCGYVRMKTREMARRGLHLPPGGLDGTRNTILHLTCHLSSDTQPWKIISLYNHLCIIHVLRAKILQKEDYAD
ncbi:hypothetical protein YC2023_050575 [Brassica napus]